MLHSQPVHEIGGTSLGGPRHVRGDVEEDRAAEAHREYLEGRGVHLSTLSEWGSGENVYSAGWAIGRLKYFPQAEVAEAYASGALQPQDILLTDAVPFISLTAPVRWSLVSPRLTGFRTNMFGRHFAGTLVAARP